MPGHLHHRVIELAAAQILRLRRRAGTTIVCENGRLWVTQEGLPDDDFLSAGESLRLLSAGLILIEATGAAPALLWLRDGAGSLFALPWRKAPA